MDKILRYDRISDGVYLVTCQREDGSVYYLNPLEMKHESYNDDYDKYICAIGAVNGCNERGEIRPI